MGEEFYTQVCGMGVRVSPMGLLQGGRVPLRPVFFKGWGGIPPWSVAWVGGVPPSLRHGEWDGRRGPGLERRRSECRSLKDVGTKPGLQISKRDRREGIPKKYARASQSLVFVLYGGKRKRSGFTVLYIRSLSYIFSFRYFIMSEAFCVGSLAKEVSELSLSDSVFVWT
jgi:hypothetical protein